MSEDLKTYMPGDGITSKSEQNEEELALTFLRGLQLLATDHFDRPEFTLEQKGVGFAPLGNIMAICAEMKNGKTWLMLSLAAALLHGKWGDVVRCDEEKVPRVLWFDTEQDKYDTMLILRRIHQMGGWDFNVDHPEFQIYNLRDIRFEKRREAVMLAIKWLKPDIVFVDGIRDLVQSVNEEQECYELINDMMAATSQYHCSIWCVLHVNPNSEKMRGHLGTELGNKVTDVFNVKKKKDKNSGNITFTVEQVAARHRDVDGWTFMIRDYPKEMRKYSEPVMLNQKEVAKVADNKWQSMHETMKKYMPNDQLSYSKTALKEAVANGERVGSSTAWKMVAEAIEMGVVEKCINGKFRIRSKAPENDMPEEQTDMPF